MKSICSVITFIFIVCLSSSSNAQGQQQLGSELRPVASPSVQTNSVVESPALMEPVTQPVNGSNNSNEIKVIDSRKVNIDSQGVQSLSVPESIPVREDEIKNPE